MNPGTRSEPIPFTSDDYADRMVRVIDDALQAGLDGLIVTPGPDLVWLTGYRPTAITERLTMLVLAPNVRPTLLVPALERPDAEAAEASPRMDIAEWVDGTDPYQAARRLLQPNGRFGISDSAWAMHLLGLQAALPEARYRALTHSLPMMRAVKDANASASHPQTYGRSTRSSDGHSKPHSRRFVRECSARRSTGSPGR